MHSVAKLKGFKTANLNVNSLLKHIDEIKDLLFNMPFDILAINESKIDNSIPDTEISIPGYNLIRKDRNRAGGGVVLYIRDHIPFSDRKDLVPDRLEMVCVEISRPHSRSFLVGTWYRPPNSDMNLFDECDTFFQKCDAERKELLIVGDLNCDVKKVPPDPHTRELQFLCSLYQFDQLIDEPTRVSSTSATLIDLVVTNIKENISASGVIHLGISDHSLIYAVRKFTIPRTKSTVKEVRDYKHFNEERFIADLSSLPWNVIQQFQNPNECWRVWKLMFDETLNRHAPLRHKRTRGKSVPWITPRIKELMRNRDYHKKQAIKHASQFHWEKFQTLRNKVNMEMRHTKSNFFHDKINDCSKSIDPKKTWTVINSLLGKNNKSNNVSELSVNENVISDSKDLAEAFNDYFITIGPKLAAEYDNDSCDNNETAINSTSHSRARFEFSPILVDSVASTLNGLKASKATGLDKIPAKILKLSSNIIAPSLTFIFNLSLTTGIYIDEWKYARVSPIFKSGDRQQCENYRPISILYRWQARLLKRRFFARCIAT